MVTSVSPVTGYVQERLLLGGGGQQGDCPEEGHLRRAFEGRAGVLYARNSSGVEGGTLPGGGAPGSGTAPWGGAPGGGAEPAGASPGAHWLSWAALCRPAPCHLPTLSLSGLGSRTGVPGPRWGQGEGKRGA